MKVNRFKLWVPRGATYRGKIIYEDDLTGFTGMLTLEVQGEALPILTLIDSDSQMSIVPDDPVVGESTINFTFEPAQTETWDFSYAELKLYVQSSPTNVIYIANGIVLLDG